MKRPGRLEPLHGFTVDLIELGIPHATGVVPHAGPVDGSLGLSREPESRIPAHKQLRSDMNALRISRDGLATDELPAYTCRTPAGDHHGGKIRRSSGSLLRLTNSTCGIDRGASGSIGSTNPSRAASSRVAPAGAEVLLIRTRDRASRWAAIRAAIVSEVTSQLAGSGARASGVRSRAARFAEPGSASLRNPARRASMSSRSTMIEPGNSLARTAAVRSSACTREPVGGFVSESVDLIERADPIRRGTAAGDQDGRFGGIVRAPRSRQAVSRPGSSGQSNRLPPTLTTARRRSGHGERSSSRRPASGSRYAPGSPPRRSARQRNQGEGTAGRRCDRAPSFFQTDDRTAQADQAVRQPPGKETARARDDRGGRLADRGRTGTLGGLAKALGQAFVGGLSEFDCVQRGEAVAVGADHPSQAVPGCRNGRRPAVSRREVVGLGLDITQDEVDIERRREDLGGQAGGDSPQWKLGRERTDGSSANARVNKLAGLEAVRCRVRPRARTCPESSGIRSAVVVPMSIRIPRDSGTKRAASVASASQFAAAASCGFWRISATE